MGMNDIQKKTAKTISREKGSKRMHEECVAEACARKHRNGDECVGKALKRGGRFAAADSIVIGSVTKHKPNDAQLKLRPDGIWGARRGKLGGPRRNEEILLIWKLLARS